MSYLKGIQKCRKRNILYFTVFLKTYTVLAFIQNLKKNVPQHH